MVATKISETTNVFLSSRDMGNYNYINTHFTIKRKRKSFRLTNIIVMEIR